MSKYRIGIEKWANGKSTEIRSIEVQETEEKRAIQCLRNIGYYQDYNGAHAGYLYENGERIATLNIVGEPDKPGYQWWISTMTEPSSV